MPLPPVPRIRLEDDAAKTIKNIQIAFERLRQGFTNAAGEAINPPDTNSPSSGPSTGQGGGGAISISDPPTGVTLTPGVEPNAINHTQEAFIDIAFTKPANAVGVEIYYREQGSDVSRQTYATDTPYRLLHLLPGVRYDIQLAGEAANGALGPTSATQSIITVSGKSNVSPSDAPYVITQSEAELENGHVLEGEDTVISIDVPTGIARVGIAQHGVSNIKLAQMPAYSLKANNTNAPANADDLVGIANNRVLVFQTATGMTWGQVNPLMRTNVTASAAIPISLTGTGAAVQMLTQDGSFNHASGKIMIPIAQLSNITGTSATANFISTILITNNANNIVYRIVGLFLGSTATITCNLFISYW